MSPVPQYVPPLLDNGTISILTCICQKEVKKKKDGQQHNSISFFLYFEKHVSLTHSLLSLSRCVLGNTTILADFASEEEINRFFAQGQSLAAPSSSWQTIGSSQSRMEQSHPFPSRALEPNQWNGGDLHSSTLWGGPNYSTSLWGAPSGNEGGRISSPSPISSFLPVDHLAGGGDSM